MRADHFLAALGLGFGVEGLVRKDWEIGNIKKTIFITVKMQLEGTCAKVINKSQLRIMAQYILGQLMVCTRT